MTAKGGFSDQELSCYLDGEAPDDLARAIACALETDPALTARLDALKAGEAAFVRAMDKALIAAPVMPALDDSPAVQRAAARTPWTYGLAGVAAGVIAAIGLSWQFSPSNEPGWRDVVASYQSLYVTETLALVNQTPAAQQADLERLSASLGIDLTSLPEAPGLSFKRAQQLGFKGKPLAQLTFLTTDGGPVALCIVRTGGDTSPDMTAEVLSGLDTYTWTHDGYGVLLVGPKGSPYLEEAAETFRSALNNATT